MQHPMWKTLLEASHYFSSLEHVLETVQGNHSPSGAQTQELPPAPARLPFNAALYRSVTHEDSALAAAVEPEAGAIADPAPARASRFVSVLHDDGHEFDDLSAPVLPDAMLALGVCYTFCITKTTALFVW